MLEAARKKEQSCGHENHPEIKGLSYHHSMMLSCYIVFNLNHVPLLVARDIFALTLFPNHQIAEYLDPRDDFLKVLNLQLLDVFNCYYKSGFSFQARKIREDRCHRVIP